MQIAFSCVLGIFMIIMVILYMQLGKGQMSEMNMRLRRTVYGIEWVIVSEIAILLVRSRQLAFLAFTSYYIALLWFIFLMFRFCITYASSGRVRFYKTVLFWVMLAGTIVLIWGYFAQGLFTITHARWLGHTLWISRRFSFFYIYDFICSIALLGAVCVLLVATVRSARIYRLKFFSIVIALVGMSILYLIAQIGQQPILMPVIGFAVGEIVIIYMAVYYAPKRFIQKALQFVADKLNDGIVLYDDEHKLQFVTDGFKMAFGDEGTQGLEVEAEYWGKFLGNAPVENVWNGHVKALSHDGRTYYYSIQHKILEEDGKLIGTVYWIQDVTESIDNYEKMVHRANFDELTGIYNEAHFYEVSKQLLEDNPDTTFVMACSGIENFKLFRDLFGKEKTQDYILQTAKVMKNGLARFPLCRYGRIGEDGFYLIMPRDCFDAQEMIRVVDGIAENFNTSNYNLSVKIGAYEILDHSLNPSMICNRTSMACDAAKGDYHKRIMWFDENVQKEEMQRERYHAELSNAIAAGDIQIYLQPQVDREGNVIGAEALARWLHGEEGLIPPVKFIPPFEESGRITELDVCIWRQACQKLKEWKEQGRKDLYISVNISAKDLYELDIYEYYMGLIREYGISPGNLKLEITESAIINDLKQQVALIGRLQEAGFEVEMDDFGSAYSSFNMLKDICVDVLKIDMKFLGDTKNTGRSQAILRSIVNLSRELNMKTVAEGVETGEQFGFLKDVGCDIYQGYYFAKPMSVDDFEARYLSWPEKVPTS